MKVSTLTTVLTGMFLVFISISCSQGQYITGSGNYITKDVEISPFNAIKLSGSAQILSINKMQIPISKFTVLTI